MPMTVLAESLANAFMKPYYLQNVVSVLGTGLARNAFFNAIKLTPRPREAPVTM